ncbi:MAG: ABC transporter permease subunit [Gaiellaceae bacterium MAG52_C11]|nr:ABC transporter permease subunit [Candidatus Gaiellasilicea maunaloa]
MSAALRAELFKQRSTRASLGLFATMIVLILFVVLLHGLGVDAGNFDTASKQISVLFGWGEFLAALFAGLLGAMSITGEIRHGTIRPTLLVNPRRQKVVLAKVWASMLIAIGFGLAAGAVAAGVGTVALESRGIDVLVGAGDYALLILGSAAAAALWAAIGVGIGSLVRNQVPALVGIVVWFLFVENLLVGDLAGVGELGRLLPAAAGKAISGQDPETLLAPGFALALLALYAVVAALVGARAASRRDVA